MEHNNTYDTKGIHIIADLHGVEGDLLNSFNTLKKIGEEAISKAGATLVDYVSKVFHPSGVTMLFLLEESHLSFHTYPNSEGDKGFIAIDMYCCGDADPETAIEYIIEYLNPDPERTYRQKIYRGI